MLIQRTRYSSTVPNIIKPDFLFVIFSFLFSLLSCNSANFQNQNNTAYTTSVLSKLQKMSPDDSVGIFTLLDSAHRNLPDPGPGDRFLLYSYTRDYFTHKKEYDKALLYIDSMLLVIHGRETEKGYMGDYATALLLRGDILLAQKHYDEAFYLLYQGKEIVSHTNDPCSYNDYNRRLADISYVQKKYLQALKYYKDAFDELSQCYDNNPAAKFAMEQAFLDNIGLCFSKLDMDDSAIVYYDKTLQYIKTQQQNYPTQDYVLAARAVVYGNKAEILSRQGNDSAAENLLKESIRINSSPNHAIEDVPYSEAKLAALYLKEARLTEASQILQQLKGHLDKMPNPDVLMNWYRLEADFYRKTKNIEKGFDYLKTEETLEDSLEDTDEKFDQIDINKEFKYTQQEYQLASLRQKDERKNFYLIGAILCSGMALIIILLILKTYRQSKKNVTALTALNEQIRLKNDELQETMYALEESQRYNAQMMKVMAHDMRSPISSIVSLYDILAHDSNYTTEQKELLDLINTSALNSLQLITDTLRFKALSEGMRKEPVDMQALLQYCVKIQEPKAARKKQKINLNAKEVTVSGDREKLWRVFSNLINNAIKFSHEGSEINIDMQVQDSSVTVSVQDNGIGIPNELKTKIFDMSAEAKRLGTSNEHSFGLGIFICKQIVEAHNGKIWFESPDGKGTTFYVTLPLS